MKTFASIARRSAVAGSTLSILALLSTLPGFAADLNVPADHPTIQAAVNAASSGDTIHIAPGVYVEQVTIVRKNLTVVGNPGAVLRAKKGMSNTLEAYGFGDVAAMLGTALSDVVVKGLTFEGEHLGETFPDASYCAIGFSGSNGRVEDCTIRGFRYANPPFYFLNAYGIVIANNKTLNTQITDVQIFRCSFADNAVSIVVNGNYGSSVNGSFGSYLSDLRQTFTIEENVIDGFGPIVGSEAGIVIGAGATGDVRHNRISGHYNTDPLIKGLLLSRKSSYSIGIFAVDWLVVFGDHPNIAALQPVRYEGNTFRNNQLHLASALGHGSQFVNNTFEGSGMGPFAGGLALSGDTNRVVGNRFTDMTRGIALVGDDPNLHSAFGIAQNPTLVGNLFCQVTMPVVTQPMVTGVTEQGTLLCPFPDPTLQIGPAVILSWPDYTDGWILEAAASVNGPWASASETPALQGRQNTVTVKTDSEHQFFRLRKP